MAASSAPSCPRPCAGTPPRRPSNRTALTILALSQSSECPTSSQRPMIMWDMKTTGIFQCPYSELLLTYYDKNDNCIWNVVFGFFRHVCHKWHYKITKAMVVCLDSRDYVQIRNSLIVLIRILPHFPVLAKLSQIIEWKIEKVTFKKKLFWPHDWLNSTVIISVHLSGKFTGSRGRKESAAGLIHSGHQLQWTTAGTLLLRDAGVQLSPGGP